MVSVLIAIAGLMGSRSLNQVDNDLRVIYAEYTLATADLGHVSGDLIRYRSAVLRAVEAQTKADFERISASLPGQRERTLKAVERFAKTSGQREVQDLQKVREGIDAYFQAANESMLLLEKLWGSPALLEAAALRRKAENNASENAGPKLIQVSLALDGLLETVTTVAGDVRKEGEQIIRMTSGALVFMSGLLVLLVLFWQRLPASSAPELCLVIPQSNYPPSSEILDTTEQNRTKRLSDREV